jgi:hypothetical protein
MVRRYRIVARNARERGGGRRSFLLCPDERNNREERSERRVIASALPQRLLVLEMHLDGEMVGRSPVIVVDSRGCWYHGRYLETQSRPLPKRVQSNRGARI